MGLSENIVTSFPLKVPRFQTTPNIILSWFYILLYPHYIIIPVVPHKAVAEVSKIGNL